jgi:hypothetical protein
LAGSGPKTGERGEGNVVGKMWWWFVERDRDGGVV